MKCRKIFQFQFVCATLRVADQQNHQRRVRQEDGGHAQQQAQYLFLLCEEGQDRSAARALQNHLQLPAGVHVSD